jgi:acyl-CoA reductase-like NAD-dependent aldehyde dehydrogenase
VEILTVTSPVNNEIYCERPCSTDYELQATVERAFLAKSVWATYSLEQRIAICEFMLTYFERNRAEIAVELSWQMGRPVTQAIGEISVMAERARYMMSIAESSLATIEIESSATCARYIQRDPLGVACIIAPWNYPYLTAINSIVPALLAGNSVVLKHSAQTPLCAERFVTAFQEAGLPPGVFSSLILTHDQVAQLVQNEMVDYVAFTGSVVGGQKIQAAAVDRFIPIGLELGGKDPAYVRHDADLDYTVSQLVDGAFFNSGQSCCGIERIYVQSQCFDKFVELYVDKVNQYNLGNPLSDDVTLGPMVSVAAANAARDQLRSALNQGATALIDSQKFSLTHLPESFLAPQVLIDVNHSMSLMVEESFAPIIGIMPVQGDQDAVALMNDSDFGLTASVWTRDMDVAKQLGGKIKTGTFFLNRCDYLDPALVWTGLKNSGRGYSLSSLGFEQLTRAKSFNLSVK